MVRIKRPQRVIACKYNSFPLRETIIDKEVENALSVDEGAALEKYFKNVKEAFQKP